MLLIISKTYYKIVYSFYFYKFYKINFKNYLIKLDACCFSLLKFIKEVSFILL